MTSAPTPYVFVSFASADAELAHRAVAALEGAGIRCWIADRDIPVAASYPAAIGAAIKGSAAVLVLLTDAANRSPHVLREVELTFNARHPIVPIRIAGTTPSSDLQYFLSTSQWLDAGVRFDEGDIARIEPVLRDLIAHPGSRRAGTPHPSPQRWWLVGAAAVVVIALVTLLLSFRGNDSDARRAGDVASPSGGPASGANGSARSDSGNATPSVTPPTPSSSVGDSQRTPTTAAADGSAASSAGAGSRTGGIQVKVNPRDGQAYVWIPAGNFVMGCSQGDPACREDEKPAHAVELPRGFWLARTEVTETQFARVMGADARATETPSRELPAVGISWSDAKAYCSRVGGRLPTEAEWEYAARGGTTTRSYGSLDAIAWFAGNSADRAHPVGTKRPNAFGLYDMLGNVSEWVRDRYFNAYDETSDPLAPEEPLAGNAMAVARGGSWLSDAAGVRVSRRLGTAPDVEDAIGIRCAADRIPG